MNINDFIIKYNGRYIDTDNAYGGQCMDLMHQYCIEFLKLSDPRILAAPAAKDVYNNFDTIFGHEYFERIPNTPNGVPHEGDIVLWGSGTWGHVAIFVEGNENSFRSFDQNYPTGSPCHIQNHYYSGCLGWLRFKESVVISPELEECKLQLADEIKKKDETWNELQEVKTDLEASQSEITTHKSFQTQLAVTLTCEDQPTAILGQITKLLSEEDQLRQALKNLEDSKMNEANCLTKLDETTKEMLGAVGKENELSRAIQAVTVERDIALRDLSEAKQAQRYEKIFSIGRLVICREVTS